MGPASIDLAIFMMDTPVVWSPFKIAVSMGVDPRYLGRREGWMLRMPTGSKRLMMSSGII